MSTTEIDPQDLDAVVRGFPDGQPVLMVNLLRFRPRADYSRTALHAIEELADVPGQEAYLTRYLPAFNRAMAPHGTSQLLFAGAVAARVVGPPGADWDAIGVATYPSIQAFRDLIDDPVYVRTAAPHRLAALADWQLFATTSLNG